MDAYTLLSDFRSRGIALIPNGEKLTAEPASRLSDADRAAIRQSKRELLRILSQSSGATEHVIEATFRDATTTMPDQAISPEFPPCPVCGATRYWICRGMVLCGSKRCGSAARFVLTSIEFRAVQ
jgi:hypothetical protein